MKLSKMQHKTIKVNSRGIFQRLLVLLVLILTSHGSASQDQVLYCDGSPACLEIRKSGSVSIRITLKPVTMDKEFPSTPILSEKEYPDPVVSIKKISGLLFLPKIPDLIS